MSGWSGATSVRRVGHHVIYVKEQRCRPAHHFMQSDPGGLAMQDVHELTDEQALWLYRIFQSREDPSLFDHLSVPDAVQNALIKNGLVRRWRDGSLEITLGGIREVAHRPLVYDDAQVAEVESA